MSTGFQRTASTAPSGTSDVPPELERPTKAQTGCSEPDQVSILEDQENHGPVLKELRGTRCTIIARWGREKFEYTKGIDDETGSGRIEVSFTPNPQTGRMTFVFDIHCFDGYSRQTTQSHEKGRPLQSEDFNTAFSGHLPDSSPAFGGRRADSPGDHPSPNIRATPNSPAVGDQLSAVHDGTVDANCEPPPPAESSPPAARVGLWRVSVALRTLSPNSVGALVWDLFWDLFWDRGAITPRSASADGKRCLGVISSGTSPLSTF